MTTYSKTYTGDGGKSNAKRAARAAGVDPAHVAKHGEGWRFPLKGTTVREIMEREVEPVSWFKSYVKAVAAAAARAKHAGLKPSLFAIVCSYKEGRPEYGLVPAGRPCKFDLATGKEKPKAQLADEAKKARVDKAATKAKPATRAKPGEGQSKQDIMRDLMLRPEGATMPEITKASGWLPHTARARISGIVAAEDLSIERTRLLGVTTYKASRKAKAA